MRIVNDNKDHIPPVVSNAVLPFPYELKIGQCAPFVSVLVCLPLPWACVAATLLLCREVRRPS